MSMHACTNYAMHVFNVQLWRGSTETCRDKRNPELAVRNPNADPQSGQGHLSTWCIEEGQHHAFLVASSCGFIMHASRMNEYRIN